MLENSVPIHKSKPPLRWIANWAGNLASRGILDISYMEENAYTGWRYKVNLFLWNTFWPIYDKFGTTYVFDFDIDEDGNPDWEDWHWDFIDEETGDAMKVIQF